MLKIKILPTAIFYCSLIKFLENPLDNLTYHHWHLRSNFKYNIDEHVMCKIGKRVVFSLANGETYVLKMYRNNNIFLIWLKVEIYIYFLNTSISYKFITINIKWTAYKRLTLVVYNHYREQRSNKWILFKIDTIFICNVKLYVGSEKNNQNLKLGKYAPSLPSPMIYSFSVTALSTSKT